MLQRVSIQNFAIIENIEIHFNDGLNIITGETGAGKSILLGALGLVLGSKADVMSLRNNDEKAIIEAIFNIKQYQMQSFFELNDIEYYEETIIRREIQPSGKSRAFINDTPTNLNILKSFTEKLIDIHAQQDTQYINENSFQLSILDAVCNHAEILENYTSKYKIYIQNKRKLDLLITQQQQSINELDFLQFQYQELKEIDLAKINEISLENELQLNENAELILQTLQQSENILTEDELTIQSLLSTLITSFKPIEKFNTDIIQIKSRLQNISIEIKDISNDVSKLKNNISYNPDIIEEIQQKLKQLHHLYKKHNVNNTAELEQVYQNLQHKIDAMYFSENEIENLKQEVETQKQELLKIATVLHHNRTENLQSLQNSITNNVRQLGMEYANFQCKLQTNEIDENGIDNVQFYFSANKGNAPQLLKNIASGGEKSRLMLVIKSILATTKALPTIIFDEIDAGISGEVGLKMGKMIQHLSQHLQIIIITHLPQIASLQGIHHFVYKDSTDQKTKTYIKSLNNNERIIQIAQMLSGENPSEAAIRNAKELLKL
jgi:DNA repair protein RecN (Recombination protein N)